jgi:peptide deformylase
MWDDCMSFPWLMVRVRRHRSISLSYTDGAGRRRDWSGIDLATSELLQHELDHLDGILAIDRVESTSDVVAREVFDRMPGLFAAKVDYTIPPLGETKETRPNQLLPDGPGRGRRPGRSS